MAERSRPKRLILHPIYNELMQEPKKRGRAPGAGKVPGSGRKATGKKMVSKRLSADVVAILEQQSDQTAYIENAIRYYHEHNQ